MAEDFRNVSRQEVQTVSERERENEYGVRYGNDIIQDYSFIYTSEFERKFDQITTNQQVNETVKTCAQDAVKDNMGRLTESMYLIDGNTGEIISQITDEKDKIDKGVHYTDKFKNDLAKAIEDKRKIIALHNHPEGYPPSIDDFRKAYDNHYAQGIVVGHNGQVYEYGNSTKSLTDKQCNVLHEEIASLYERGYDVDRAYKSIYKNLNLMYNIIE